MNARKIVVSVAIILLSSLSPAGKANLVADPNFESQEIGPVASPWLAGYCYNPDHDSNCETKPPEIYVSADIIADGFEGQCLRMERGDPNITWQGTRQMLGAGSITSNVYELSAYFNTSTTHNGYINLHDPSWKNASGSIGKSHTITVQGKGDWHTIRRLVRVPETDDYNQPIVDHNWAVYLYGYSPNNDLNDIYYDNIEVRIFDTNSIQPEYNQIEERSDWNIGCQTFTDGYPLQSYDENMIGYIDANTDPNISGDKTLVVRGTRTTKNTYVIALPVKPSTKYKISAKVKYEDRNCYNYLDLNYPASMTDPNQTTLKRTKGIWCGLFYVNIGEFGAYSTATANLLPPLIIDSPYISYEDRQWYFEQQYFKTSPDASELLISVSLTGFDGKLYIDELTVKEDANQITNEQMRIPIDYEFEGMKITGVNYNPLSVQTNAGNFIFDGNSIELQKDSSTVGKLLFEEENILSGLDVNQDINGLVLLENSNITISIGADSSMIVRLAKGVNVTVTDAKSPKFYNFDAGVVFVSDYQKGMLFSPIFPELNIGTMPYVYDGNIKDHTYDDSALDRIGLKNWTEPNLAEPNWSVTYTFEDGDGFVVSVFPPKDFNNSDFARERMSTASPNLNMYPDGDYSYFIQKFREHYNVMLLWQGAYNVSDNNTAPTFYYIKNGIPVSPNEPNATAVPFIHNDVAGPFIVREADAMNRIVEQAHAKGVKVIVYMSPSFFYTTDIDELLLNLKNNIDTYNIDGVYFDGYNDSRRLLKSVELVRKARNLLQDKLYYQHSSWSTNLIRWTDRLRIPCMDAYADNIWLGEGVKKDLTGDPNFWDLDCNPDPNAWGLLYCNKNLSNTPSTLLAECRPVDWGDSEANSLAITLEPNEQIAYQLNYNGIFRTSPFSGTYQNSIYDSKFGKPIYYDWRQWWEPYDSLCLSYTRGDGIADVGETIYSSQEDCAPETSEAILGSYDNTYECTSNYSVAQWIIDGNQPFYRLHLTFDGNLAADDSDNKMHPYHVLGVYNTASDLNYAPAVPLTEDGRKTFYFDGTTKIFGTHDDTLCFTDDYNNTKDFSSFAVIKRADSSSSKQYVFSLNSDTHFSYGINNGRFFIRVKNSSGVLQDYDSGIQIDQNWHTVGVVYDAEGQSGILKLYVDGNIVSQQNLSLYKFSEFGTYYIGAYYVTDISYRFKGYVDDLFVIDRSLTDEQAMQYHETLHKKMTIDNVSNVSCVVTDGTNKYTAVGGGNVINIVQLKSYDIIQDAIDDANNGDEIVVYPGTYYESINFNGKDVTLRSFDPNDWDVVEATVIDGNGATNVVTFDSGESGNSAIEGFTVKGGIKGVYIDNTSPVITKCILQGNATGLEWKNTNANSTIVNNIIRDNTNEGILASKGNATIKNNLVYGNDRGMKLTNASAIISNNTIVNNTSYGIEKSGSSGTLTISNCIVWNNSDDLQRCDGMFSYSCIQDTDDSGTGVIHSDPCFISGDEYFHIGIHSLSVNAGNPGGSYTGETDIDGEERMINGRVDIGSDEFSDFPAHWWKLDETVGVTADDFTGDANGMFNGDDPCWVDGLIVGAIDCNGISDYFSVSSLDSAYDLYDNFTVAGWFKTSQSTGIQTIVGQWSCYKPPYQYAPDLHFGWQVLVENNKVVARFGAASPYPSDITGTSDVNDGEWHHFALVYPTYNSNAVLYVDGQQEGTPGNKTFYLNYLKFRIGDGSYVSSGSPDLKGGPFCGMIDDVMIYNRVLSAEEVTALYESGRE